VSVRAAVSTLTLPSPARSAGFALVYALALATETGRIYRVWPAERIEPLLGAELAKEAKLEPLLLWRRWAALGRGLHFSVLSAFHLGSRASPRKLTCRNPSRQIRFRRPRASPLASSSSSDDLRLRQQPRPPE
jgi:hypothetical protein